MTMQQAFEQYLAERGLDEDQLKAVYSDDHTVVSAGAGSGKTTVLSFRFLRLVAERKAESDSILTLTFTRKAAAEMKERIHSMMLDFDTHPEFRTQAAKMDKAAISTIDSFCAKIVRSDCSRYGITPDFRQDDEQILKLARRTAASFIHDQLHTQALRRLLGIYSFEDLLEKLFIRLSKDHASPSRPVEFGAQSVQYLKLIEHKAAEALDELILSARLVGELEPRNKSLAAAIAWFTAVGSRLLPAVEDRRFQEAADILESLGYLRSPSSTKQEDMAILKEQILSSRPHVNVLKNALHLLASSRQISEVYDLLDAYVSRFLRQKRDSGLLSFSDIAAMAVDILKSNAAIRRWYAREFSHIMIDEFQDNNRLQKDLLYLLASRDDYDGQAVPGPEDLEPGKLFFVGDAKQSIYRFRNADVSVFTSLSRELAACGCSSVELKRNYRSEPGLIHAFNEIFPRVMGNVQHEYEATFEALLPREGSSGVVPEITLCLKPKQKPDESEEQELVHADESEAWFIAHKIKRIAEGRSLSMFDRKTKQVRPVGYDDIALLLHALSNQMHYESAFRALGIPFVTQSVRALFLEAPVNDIYQMLQLIVYPDDRQAFAALLRSPFARVGDDLLPVIFDLLEEEDSLPAFDERLEKVFDHDFPAWQGAGQTFFTQLDENRIRYEHGRDTYVSCSRLAVYAGITELVEYLWYHAGYRFTVLKNPTHHRYLEFFEYLREMAMRADSAGESLPEFLDEIRSRLGTNERISEIELLRRQSAGVQIMTLHKSKGLEFPVVFISNAGNRGSGDREPLIHTNKDNLVSISCTEGVLLPGSKTPVRNFGYLLEKERIRLEQQAELKRLLYVGMTRAESHLFITGYQRPVSEKKEAGDYASLLEFSLDAFGLDPYSPQEKEGELPLTDPRSARARVEIIPDITEAESRELRGSTTRTRTARSMTATYNSGNEIRYEASPRVQSVSSLTDHDGHGMHANRLEELPSDALLDDWLVPVFGTYCHQLIEAMLKRGDDADVSLPEEFGDLTAGQQHQISRDARILAYRVIDSDFLKTMRGDDNASIESEVPFLLKENEMLIRGKIDLLITLSDRVYVIDFKSDAAVIEGLHDAQLAYYMKAASALTGKPVEGRIWYLRDKEQFTWQRS
jgi:ATP-dependent exoDNAse (exonuclease V) beta subunit